MRRIILITLAFALSVFVPAECASIITGVPTDTVVIPAGVVWQRTVEIEKTDFDWPLSWSIQSIGRAPIGDYDIESGYRGVFRFTPSWGDTGNVFRFRLKVTDKDNDVVNDEFAVLVREVVPPVIQIAVNHSFLHAGTERVAVFKSGGELRASTMRLTIAFAEGGLFFDSISTSNTVLDRDWNLTCYEKKETSYGEMGLPLTIVKIGGANLSSADALVPSGKLFDLSFTSSADRKYDGRFDRISFTWQDCDDNTFRSNNLDTVYMARQVVSFDPLGGRRVSEVMAKTNCFKGGAISIDGPCTECTGDTLRFHRVPQIRFCCGGVDRACCEYDVDYGGDMNLNDIAYEIADFELMSRWLAFGDSVLNINPAYRQAQIATSDANLDGTKGGVADMVYLARVIIGDALPFPKLRPFEKVALFDTRHDTVFAESSDSIAGILMLIKADATTQFENLTGIEMVIGSRGQFTTLLFKPSLDNLQGHIAAGRSALVHIKGEFELQSFEISNYNGSLMIPRRQ